MQQLAQERVRDAEALLKAGQWSGAYYLAGYAVECALKARIAKLTNQYDFPDKDLALRCFTHKIEVLVDAAELIAERKIAVAANPAYATSWLVVARWEEKARYQLWTEADARELVKAVTDINNGVLPWIVARW